MSDLVIKIYNNIATPQERRLLRFIKHNDSLSKPMRMLGSEYYVVGWEEKSSDGLKVTDITARRVIPLNPERY